MPEDFLDTDETEQPLTRQEAIGIVLVVLIAFAVLLAVCVSGWVAFFAHSVC